MFNNFYNKKELETIFQNVDDNYYYNKYNEKNCRPDKNKKLKILFVRGGLIYEEFCYKKINNFVYKIDRMSCTKIKIIIKK